MDINPDTACYSWLQLVNVATVVVLFIQFVTDILGMDWKISVFLFNFQQLDTCIHPKCQTVSVSHIHLREAAGPRGSDSLPSASLMFNV